MDALKSSVNNQHLPWMRLYKQVSQLDSICCHKLCNPDPESVLPSARASHSLNFVSDCLVLFGGGCEGGQSIFCFALLCSVSLICWLRCFRVASEMVIFLLITCKAMKRLFQIHLEFISIMPVHKQTVDPFWLLQVN